MRGRGARALFGLGRDGWGSAWKLWLMLVLLFIVSLYSSRSV